MSSLSNLSWEARALAAERTCEVLKNKVYGLMNGDKGAIQKRLERARQREEENRRKRAVMKARANELAKYTEGLEQEVAERTRDLKVILDNVTFGFLVVDRELKIQDGYTQSCCSLLGADTLTGACLLDALHLEGERDRDHYLMSVDEVFEDIMPEELTLYQMPQRFEAGGRALKVEGRVIRDEEGEVKGLLMTISDISALEAAERENRMNQTLLGILKERESFKHFLADTKAQLSLAHEAIDDEKYVRRVVHTIKGNSGSYGLDSIAEAIHHIEDQVEIASTNLDQITNEFTSYLKAHEGVLEMSFDDVEGDSFEVSADRLEELKMLIAAGTDEVELRRWTAEVYLKPARSLLGPFPTFVEKLAARLEKSIEFEGKGLDTLVDAGTMQPIFQNLTHLVRNSVDHGIEADGCRGEKPEKGKISLEIREEEGAWIVEMSDDGQGIDTARLAQRSVEKGAVTQEAVDKMSDAEKMRLVFLDGVSSAEQTTDISGRGVGMSAVLDEVERAYGTVTIQSELGKGTKFILRVPKPEVLKKVFGAPRPKEESAAIVHAS